jgi:hypothetical protein
MTLAVSTDIDFNAAMLQSERSQNDRANSDVDTVIAFRAMNFRAAARDDDDSRVSRI